MTLNSAQVKYKMQQSIKPSNPLRMIAILEKTGKNYRLSECCTRPYRQKDLPEPNEPSNSPSQNLYMRPKLGIISGLNYSSP